MSIPKKKIIIQWKHLWKKKWFTDVCSHIQYCIVMRKTAIISSPKQNYYGFYESTQIKSTIYSNVM